MIYFFFKFCARRLECGKCYQQFNYENKVFRIGLSATRLVLLPLQIIVLPNAGALLLLLVNRFGDECANERPGLLHFTTTLRCIALFNTDSGSNFAVVIRMDEQSPKSLIVSKSSEMEYVERKNRVSFFDFDKIECLSNFTFRQLDCSALNNGR